MCFRFLYLYLFSAVEPVLYGKALQKYNQCNSHYYYFSVLSFFSVCFFLSLQFLFVWCVHVCVCFIVHSMQVLLTEPVDSE